MRTIAPQSPRSRWPIARASGSSSTTGIETPYNRRQASPAHSAGGSGDRGCYRSPSATLDGWTGVSGSPTVNVDPCPAAPHPRRAAVQLHPLVHGRQPRPPCRRPLLVPTRRNRSDTIGRTSAPIGVDRLHPAAAVHPPPHDRRAASLGVNLTTLDGRLENTCWSGRGSPLTGLTAEPERSACRPGSACKTNPPPLRRRHGWVRGSVDRPWAQAVTGGRPTWSWHAGGPGADADRVLVDPRLDGGRGLLGGRLGVAGHVAVGVGRLGRHGRDRIHRRLYARGGG